MNETILTSFDPRDDEPAPAPEASADIVPDIPAKFRDPETGEVRVGSLLKSYGELERMVAGMVRVPGEDADAEEIGRFRRLLGVPDTPEGYDIETKHELLEPDPEVNRRLHAAGFTPAQAQLVYDLAADYVVPLLEDLGSEFEADRQHARLVEHFGGEDAWREASRQLLAWGRANLPAEALAALSGTAEGVIALHNMMRSGEPGLLGGGRDSSAPRNEAELDEMMRDPRYWRTRDPDFVARVTEGFKRLYPE